MSPDRVGTDVQPGEKPPRIFCPFGTEHYMPAGSNPMHTRAHSRRATCDRNCGLWVSQFNTCAVAAIARVLSINHGIDESTFR